MRIKLKKGKQKELLIKFKEGNNFTWKEFSKFLNVSEPALREWYKESNLLPLNIYEILDKKRVYKKCVLEIKKDNWGQVKAGLNSKGSLKEITIPNECKELAELIGAVLGDGNICSYKKGKKVGVYNVNIAGDYKKDKDYHLKHIKPLIENLFDLKANIIIFPKVNERFVVAYSRELVRFFGKNGLKPGNKIINENSIPYWIFENKNFLKCCVRGLIDTDGSIFRMSRKDPNLLRINFKNFNQKLLRDTRRAFVTLGFHPSKIICNNVFYLSRKADIVKYIKEIGFSNQRHQKRFKEFINSPMV